jgi:hypothetical protein
VGVVLQEDLGKSLLLETKMVHCESSRKDGCLATWRTETHGGTEGWDRQGGVPSVEQLFVDTPSQ